MLGVPCILTGAPAGKNKCQPARLSLGVSFIVETRGQHLEATTCALPSCLAAVGELSNIAWDNLFTTLLGDQAKAAQLRPLDEHGRWVLGTQQLQQQPLTRFFLYHRPLPLHHRPLPTSALNADDHLEYIASSRFITPVQSKVMLLLLMECPATWFAISSQRCIARSSGISVD